MSLVRLFILVIFIVLAFLITGCSTTVPVTQKFPDAPDMIKEKCPEIIDLMKLMRKTIYDKFNIPYASFDCEEKDFELLKWEFENIIKSSNADFWLPERAKFEFIGRFIVTY